MGPRRRSKRGLGRRGRACRILLGSGSWPERPFAVGSEGIGYYRTLPTIAFRFFTSGLPFWRSPRRLAGHPRRGLAKPQSPRQAQRRLRRPVHQLHRILHRLAWKVP